MKKLLILFFLITTSASFAQGGLGVTAGLNYGDNGEIEYQDIQEAGSDIIRENGDSKTGYHFGLFYRGNLGPVFLKPELLYTQMKSSYDINNSESEYTVSKLDLPIMVGIKVLGPLNLFAGPSLQYILENDFQGVNLSDVEEKFSIGAQFGAGIQFSGIGLDVRYERGLSENQAEALGFNESGVARIDSRPSQLIFSISLNL